MKNLGFIFLLMSGLLFGCTSTPKRTPVTTLGDVLKSQLLSNNGTVEEGFSSCVNNCVDPKEKELAKEFLSLQNAMKSGSPEEVNLLARRLTPKYAELLQAYENDDGRLAGVLYYGWYLAGGLIMSAPESARDLFFQVQAGMKAVEKRGITPAGFSYLKALQVSSSPASLEKKIEASRQCVVSEPSLFRCRELYDRQVASWSVPFCPVNAMNKNLKIFFAAEKKEKSYGTRIRSLTSPTGELFLPPKPVLEIQDFTELRREAGDKVTYRLALTPNAGKTMMKARTGHQGYRLVFLLKDIELGTSVIGSKQPSLIVQESFIPPKGMEEQIWKSLCSAEKTKPLPEALKLPEEGMKFR